MPTQLSATPPARHRSRRPVSRCANAVIFSITSSVMSWTDRARSISRCVSLLSGLRAGPPNSSLERAARHRQPVRIREVLQVHPQAAIVADLEQVVLDGLDVLRLAVRRQAHHLVLAGVHPEAGEVGERRIQQAERVRKAQLLEHLDRIAAADADRRGRPLADAVHRHDRRLLERRRIERRGRVRFVMLAEQNLAFVAFELARRCRRPSTACRRARAACAIRYEREPRGAQAM